MPDNHEVALEETVERRVRESFACQGLMAHLGASIVELWRGLVSVRMPYRLEVSQQDGYFHGGGLSAIADTAGGYAAFTMFPEDSSVLTVEYKLNLINPARGDYVDAIGRVIKSGRTLTVCQMDVYAVDNGSPTHVAIAQQTLICVKSKQHGSSRHHGSV